MGGKAIWTVAATRSIGKTASSLARQQRFVRHSDVRLTTTYAKPPADEVDLIDKPDYPDLTAHKSVTFNAGV